MSAFVTLNSDFPCELRQEGTQRMTYSFSVTDTQEDIQYYIK